jgi:nucleoside-diphosphate-sugar epimerase
MPTLIIGTGFIGGCLARNLRARGVHVTQSSRTPARSDVRVGNGADLDRLLAKRAFNQVVVTGQLTGMGMEWILERIDGPRWIVMSSQQLASSIEAPNTPLALAQERFAVDREACVLRPTMVYGSGLDHNVSRLIRLIDRCRLAFLPRTKLRLLQPVHVDDLSSLIWAHATRPVAGLYSVAGPEALSLYELAWMICEIRAVRHLDVQLPSICIRLARHVAPLLGLRRDQILRLDEDKTADFSAATKMFSWRPAPLGIRLEQACHEIDSAVDTECVSAHDAGVHSAYDWATLPPSSITSPYREIPYPAIGRFR